MASDLETRVQNREMREWGRANGWPDLPQGGRVPAELRDAWEAAHQAPADVGFDVIEPPDGGFTEAELDAAFGFDETGMDLAAEFPDPGADGPPAPASLDEARAQVSDEGAAHLRKQRPGRRQRVPRETRPAPKITKAVLGDIEGKLAFWLSLTAEPWAVADPYCGGAYADQVPEIAKRAAPLICQSPALVAWFGKSSTFILWTELGIAVRPVATAVIKHHVTRTVQVNNGVVAEVRPESREDFSAYASRPAA